MQFILADLGLLAGLGELPAHLELDAGLVEAILNEAGRFASGVLCPLNVIGARWVAGEVHSADG